MSGNKNQKKPMTIKSGHSESSSVKGSPGDSGKL